jgi:hydrogenase-4 membrane subunit HyfE
MSGALLWMLAGTGVTVVVVRRRSVAVALVTAQALILAGFALYEANGAGDVVAAGALALRAVALAFLFLLLVSRTRELRPVHARVPPLLRAGAAVAFALILATRRATLFHVLGIVLVENGLALAALELPGGASLTIELGVALDLMLVALVAGVFHERIFAEFGAGDSAALRTLRD